MKRNKLMKWTCGLLTAAMMAAFLTACGGSDDAGKTTDNTSNDPVAAETQGNVEDNTAEEAQPEDPGNLMTGRQLHSISVMMLYSAMANHSHPKTLYSLLKKHLKIQVP